MCCRGYICCLDMLKSSQNSDSESDDYDRNGSNTPAQVITTARDNSQTLRQNLAATDEQFKSTTSNSTVTVEVHNNVTRIIGCHNSASTSPNLRAKDIAIFSGDVATDCQLNANDKGACIDLFDASKTNNYFNESSFIQPVANDVENITDLVEVTDYDNQQNAVVSNDLYESSNDVNENKHFYLLKKCVQDISVDAGNNVSNSCTGVNQIKTLKAVCISPQSEKKDNSRIAEFCELGVESPVAKMNGYADAIIKKSGIKSEPNKVNELELNVHLLPSTIQDKSNYKTIDDLNIPWIVKSKNLNNIITQSDNAQEFIIHSSVNLGTNKVLSTNIPIHTSDNNSDTHKVYTPKDLNITDNIPLETISILQQHKYDPEACSESINRLKTNQFLNKNFITTGSLNSVVKDVANILDDETNDYQFTAVDLSGHVTSPSMTNLYKNNNNTNICNVASGSVECLADDIINTSGEVEDYWQLNALNPNHKAAYAHLMDTCETNNSGNQIVESFMLKKLSRDDTSIESSLPDLSATAKCANIYETPGLAYATPFIEIMDGFNASKLWKLPADSLIAEPRKVIDTSTKRNNITAELNCVKTIAHNIDLSESNIQKIHTKSEDLNIPWIDDANPINTPKTLQATLGFLTEGSKKINAHCDENVELVMPLPNNNSASFKVDTQQRTSFNTPLKDISILSEISYDQSIRTHMFESVNYSNRHNIAIASGNSSSKVVADISVRHVCYGTLDAISANNQCLSRNLVDTSISDAGGYFNERDTVTVMDSDNDVASVSEGKLNNRKLNTVTSNGSQTCTQLINIWENRNCLNGSRESQRLKPFENNIPTQCNMVDFSTAVTEAQNNNSMTVEFCKLSTDSRDEKIAGATETCSITSTINIESSSVRELKHGIYLSTSTKQKDEINCEEINNLNFPFIDDSKQIEMIVTEPHKAEDVAKYSYLVKNGDKKHMGIFSPIASLHFDPTAADNMQHCTAVSIRSKEKNIGTDLNFVGRENTTNKNLQEFMPIPYIDEDNITADIDETASVMPTHNTVALNAKRDKKICKESNKLQKEIIF